MKEILVRTVLIFVTAILVPGTIKAQTSLSEVKSRFPNELPSLALYAAAKWKSIEAYVSTRKDVERVLGEPIPVYSETLRTWTTGYEYIPDCPDWRIIITYIGEGGSLPNSLIDRVFNIRLEPKKRISLKFTAFPKVFMKGYSRDLVNKAEFVSYDDPYGLHYSVYSKDSSDRRVRRGDLMVIIYGASDETEAKYNPNPSSVSDLRQDRTQDPRQLCNRVSEIKVLPFTDEQVNDSAYNALIEAGEEVIPCLIEKVTDMTPMADPRQAPKTDTFVGDVAFFVLMNMTKGDLITLLPAEVQKGFKEEGVYTYFRYAGTLKNRQKLQNSLNEWYSQKYGKDAHGSSAKTP